MIKYVVHYVCPECGFEWCLLDSEYSGGECPRCHYRMLDSDRQAELSMDDTTERPGLALDACGELIQAYQNGEEACGEIDWSDVDEAYQLARRALGMAGPEDEAEEVEEPEEAHAHHHCSQCVHIGDKDAGWWRMCVRKNRYVDEAWMACEEFEQKKEDE